MFRYVGRLSCGVLSEGALQGIGDFGADVILCPLHRRAAAESTGKAANDGPACFTYARLAKAWNRRTSQSPGFSARASACDPACRRECATLRTARKGSDGGCFFLLGGSLRVW